MKKFMLFALLLAACNLARAQSSSSSGQNSSSSCCREPSAASPASNAKRVRVNRQGFDLDPKSTSQSGPQMGAGSRGGERSTMELYAPNLGLSYTAQPLFQWKADSSNRSMTFKLFDQNDNEVYEADVTGQTSLTYPQDAPALKSGDTYRWTVESKGLGMLEPPPSAHLKVLSGTQRQQLQQELKAIAGDGKPQQIERAQLFADNGIWYDAVADYSKLITQYPNDAKLYQARGEIYNALPQTKTLAAQDMAKGH